MSAMNPETWSAEAWDAVLGPDTSPEDVIENAEHDNMTPQTWILNACEAARNAMGACPSLSDAFKEVLVGGGVFEDLCRQCGIPAM